MSGPCKCPTCNAPEPEHHCFDCGHVFTQHEEEFKDRAENPQCHKCHDKLIDMADALRKQDMEDEWNRREQSRRVDKEYVDRRMPYEDTPKRGWWT
jgi:hypothetical protein